MAFEKVKDNNDYIKNPNTGNVINTNTANYLARKGKKRREELQRNEINNLKTELQELKKLVEKLTNGD